MGKEYGSSNTVSSVIEASGAGGFFAADSKSVAGKRIGTKKGAAEITKAWSIHFEDTTMDSSSEMTDEIEDGNVTNLLQTNLLLIAVLIVCFITLASVISICGCMIRRYCKNRVQGAATGIHQPIAVSKSTSITGLNGTCEYYSTKTKNGQEFSPTIATQNEPEKTVSCESNSEPVFGLTKSPSMTIELNSAKSQQVQHSHVVLPTRRQNDCPLNSTPGTLKPNCNDGGDRQSMDGRINSTDPTETLNNCDTFTSTLREQPRDIDENFSQAEEESTDDSSIATQVLMRGPLTHSVSWFVSLNGDKTGSIRHSITEKTYQELSMKSCENCPPDQKNGKHSNKGKGRNGSECHPLYEVDERDSATGQPVLISSKLLNDNPICLAPDEKIPLIRKIRHSSASESQTATTPLSSFSCVDENQDPCQNNSHATLSQSLSLPDDANTWKQREERPVLFLGSGVK